MRLLFALCLSLGLVLPSGVNAFGMLTEITTLTPSAATTAAAAWTSQAIATTVSADAVVQAPTSPEFVNNMNPISAYLTALATFPLYTKMATGAMLAVAGDAIAQAREEDVPYDKRRAVSFAAFDAAYRALQHVAYPAIVAHFHGQYLCSLASLMFSQYYLPLDFAAALERTLCSQLGIVPFLYYPVFFTLTAALQGLDLQSGVQRAQTMFIPLMSRNLLFWIPVQYIQFSFVPEDLQIPFISVAGLMWTFILSVLAGAAKQAHHHDHAHDKDEQTSGTTGADVDLSSKEDEEPYCVIGCEGDCVVPDDLFPHASMEDISHELSHEWEEITHFVLDDHHHHHHHDDTNHNKENESTSTTTTTKEKEKETSDTTTTTRR